MSVSFQASVRSGFGSGGYYVSLPYYSSYFRQILGKDAFPGTLNVLIAESDRERYYRYLEKLHPTVIPAKIENNLQHWKVFCFPCKIFVPNLPTSVEIDCLALEFSNPDHQRGVVELVSSVRLRSYFNLNDSDPILLNF